MTKRRTQCNAAQPTTDGVHFVRPEHRRLPDSAQRYQRSTHDLLARPVMTGGGGCDGHDVDRSEGFLSFLVTTPSLSCDSFTCPRWRCTMHGGSAASSTSTRQRRSRAKMFVAATAAVVATLTAQAAASAPVPAALPDASRTVGKRAIRAVSPPNKAPFRHLVLSEERNQQPEPQPQLLLRKRGRLEDKCNGKRMFYIPLLRSTDGEELGVCDSACHAIADTVAPSASELDAATQRDIGSTRRAKHSEAGKRRLDTDMEWISQHSSNSGHKTRIEALARRASASSSTSTSTGTDMLFHCDDQQTLPEENVPEEQVNNFPFHMRTCYSGAPDRKMSRDNDEEGDVHYTHRSTHSHTHADIAREVLAQTAFEEVRGTGCSSRAHTISVN